MLAINVADRTGAALIATAVAVWLGAGVACVDGSLRAGGSGGSGGAGGVGPAVCDVPPPVPYSGAAVIPSEDPVARGPYAWKNAVIKGGGFVTGPPREDFELATEGSTAGMGCGLSCDGNKSQHKGNNR